MKLSLVSALAHSPRLLLLDEPTSGIDPVVRTEVLDVLFEILESGDRAIFYATHFLPEISRLADELAFIHNGQMWLRTDKEALAEKWRKISYSLDKKDIRYHSVVSHVQEGKIHQIVSSDFEVTLHQLKILGAEDITDTRMGIEEIAVQILKGKQNVEAG